MHYLAGNNEILPGLSEIWIPIIETSKPVNGQLKPSPWEKIQRELGLQMQMNPNFLITLLTPGIIRFHSSLVRASLQKPPVLLWHR